ncbi:U-box domain-containing protein 24-like [Tasmannia lanceolata]|uniref:U-box domain-containing protein 24-like n=1 Tax=Tasmannia lanceolata TaxID=3420 RepID=UPI004064236A
MGSTDSNPSFSELISELLESVDEISFLSNKYEIKSEVLSQFVALIEEFTPILNDLKENEIMDTPPVRKAVESLGAELQRAFILTRDFNSRVSVKQIEDVTHNLGRCLGLLLFSSFDMSVKIKDKIEILQKEMINAKFDDEEDLIRNLKGGKVDRIDLDIDDVVLHLKNGDDEQFGIAISELSMRISDKSVSDEWVNERGIIQILLNRMGASKHDNRLAIILLLRSLASENDENKEKMADAGSLLTVVRSLTRDVLERREAVGLLLSLSEIPRVRQRIGRVQGCIVMLVSMRNGDDPCASCDAGKLLSALSGNTQNVLHMAEAGYFKPLVQYLKKGPEMSKILMATALSRMELTDQSKSALGVEGSIEPLVKMFNSGKLEAKLTALGALQNLSTLAENVPRLVNSGIVAPLLQLLFSVTSVLMTLREPASAILASIAQSELILIKQDVVQKMLSLLNLSSPVIQYHLLRALNSITSHSRASKVRAKMKENGAIQLLLPFLTEDSTEIKTVALNLLYNLSKDQAGELTEQLGETYLNIIINTISTSTSENEKAAAIGLISNLPVKDKKATEILKRTHLLPILISLLGVSTTNSTPTRRWLLENIAGVMVLFTVPWDKKLQRQSAELGVIHWLVRLLSIGSPIAKSRAATSLAQLSQNSISLSKRKGLKWSCVPPSSEAFCEVHDGYCFSKSTFCLVKAGAISPLIQILEGKDREADEAVLTALATLMQDEIWEKGSILITKASGVLAIMKVLEVGSLKALEKAIWMLERMFRIETLREQYGQPAQVLLIDLAQKGAPILKPMIARILAHLELLQTQSSYF